MGLAGGKCRHVLRSNAHHRAPAGIERHRGQERQPDIRHRSDRRVQLVLRVHRLDPGHVHAAPPQPLGLLGEGVDRFGVGALSEWLQNVAGGTHGAGDDDRALRPIRDTARDCGARFVDFSRTVSEAVQREPVAIRAERVGEDDVGTRRDHVLVDGLDPGRFVEVPALAGGAAGQSQVEQVRAHGAVGEKPVTFGPEALSEDALVVPSRVQWIRRAASARTRPVCVQSPCCGLGG